MIDENVWDHKEFDWTGKSFYYIPITFVLGKPIGLGGKLEQLNREARAAGYKILNSRVLIQHASFKGRAMIEVEKQDQYDAQVVTYDDSLRVDTIVYKGSQSGLGKSIKSLTERVAAKRGMPPREIYSMYVSDSSAFKTIIFAFT